MLRWLRKLLGHLPPPEVRQESDPPEEIRGQVRTFPTGPHGAEGRTETLGAPLTCFEGQVTKTTPADDSRTS
jgi:hypothetical protein